MTKSQLVTAGANTATTAGATQYWFLSVGSITAPSTTLANKQIIYRSAGTLTSLYVRVAANTTSLSSTVNVRINATNGTLTLTVGAGATGVFEDTTHSDAVVAADLLAYRTISGGTGTMSMAVLSTIFDPTTTTDTVSRITAGPASASFTVDSVTRYNTIVGTISASLATEPALKTRITKPGTMKNLGVYISANARTTDTIVRGRKNGANGNLTLTIGAAVTGMLEDTSNTDTVVAGDDYNYDVTTSTGAAQALAIQSISSDFVTTSAEGLLASGISAGLAQAVSVTNYFPVGGNLAAGTTEADRKVKPREAFTLSLMTISVTANTVTASSTLRLRKNGANGNQLVTIPASTTGYLSDNTNRDRVLAADEMNYELTTGATGTSLTLRNITVNATRLALAELSDTIVVSEPSMVRLGTKLRALSTETITIGEAIAKIKGAIRALATQTITISEASLVNIRGKVRALSDTITIGEAIAKIAGKIRVLAAQTVTISDGVVRLVARSVIKTLSETDLITEGIGRLKAVWRLQPP